MTKQPSPSLFIAGQATVHRPQLFLITTAPLPALDILWCCVSCKVAAVGHGRLNSAIPPHAKYSMPPHAKYSTMPPHAKYSTMPPHAKYSMPPHAKYSMPPHAKIARAL